VRQLLFPQGTFVVADPPPLSVSCFDDTASPANLQRFDFTRGAPTALKVSTATPYGVATYCVDFGTTPANGGKVTLNVCRGTPGQTFWVTADNRVAQYQGKQCLDVVRGSTPSDEKPYGTLADVQTWECTTGDVQQASVSLCEVIVPCLPGPTDLHSIVNEDGWVR
jgi:hypothetical protein